MPRPRVAIGTTTYVVFLFVRILGHAGGDRAISCWETNRAMERALRCPVTVIVMAAKT